MLGCSRPSATKSLDAGRYATPHFLCDLGPDAGESVRCEVYSVSEPSRLCSARMIAGRSGCVAKVGENTWDVVGFSIDSDGVSEVACGETETMCGRQFTCRCQ
jgi:hypothetical protein